MKINPSGIYIITNKKLTQCYIGQSENMVSRLALHRRELRNGRHKNRKLQLDFIHFGEINFDFECLEYVSPDKLDERELFWIQQKNPIYNARHDIAGRPTYYDEPMIQTAVWLPQEMIDWLKAQPSTMGETIRKLIKEAMQ